MIRRNKKSDAILAIGLEEHLAGAAVVEQSGGARVLGAAASFSMSLNLLKDAPDLVGSELRQHLDAAHIHVKRCILCVPARWLLCAQVPIPELPEQDIPGYIELQAERQFPLAGDEIVYAASQYQTPDGVRGATLLALPLNRLQKLQALARAARLEVIGVTSPVAALARWNRPAESAVLLAEPERVELAITGFGGLVNLRALGGAPHDPMDAGGIEFNGLGRELRISMKRLPKSLSAAIGSIEVYGEETLVPELVAAVRDALGGAEVTVRTGTADIPHRDRETGRTANPALVAAADLYLRGAGIQPNFLPPRPGRFEELVRTALKRRTTSLVAGAAGLLLLASAAFAIQARTLHVLEAEMEALGPRAESAGALQDQIRTYRDWFDAGAPTLDIASGLTEAFPEEGTVWLKSASIKNGATITCSGKATGNRAWLEMLESLRAAPAFGGVQVSQVRGDAPLEFNFSCTWLKGAR